MSQFNTLSRNAVSFHDRSGAAITPAEHAATQFVRRLGIRSHLKGYRCLITAIVLGEQHPHLLHSLTNELYPAVAQVCSTTSHAVERNIRSAIGSAAANNPEQLQSVFYYKTGKPYISEVLALALETMRLEQYETQAHPSQHMEC